jgi:hypothetical protein
MCDELGEEGSKYKGADVIGRGGEQLEVGLATVRIRHGCTTARGKHGYGREITAVLAVGPLHTVKP